MKIGRKVNLTVELSREELTDVTSVTVVLHYPGGKKTLTIDENYQIHLCHNGVPPSVPSIQTTRAAHSASPANEKSFLFKRKKVIPYGMSVATDPLENFIRFFISPKAKKKFEEEFYRFFLENPEGKKFLSDKATIWQVGLWLKIDPEGLAKACGGKGTTFTAIEYAFSGISRQLIDRVKSVGGVVPKPYVPVIRRKKRSTSKVKSAKAKAVRKPK